MQGCTSVAGAGCAGATSYFLYDGHGSTRALADGTGAVTDTYDYDAYGSLIDSTGTTENSYLYTGEQFDSTLGDYYLRARYYDPAKGRFLTQDTFMGWENDPRSLHKYVYGHGDPVNGSDPSGMFTLQELSIANTIRSEGITLQTDVGFSLFDAGINNDDYYAANSSNFSGIFMLGAAGAKIAGILSKKARKLCPTGAANCIRALFGRIKTPYGTARQLDSPAAWSALQRAQSGAPLYRLGRLGKSKGSEAQFWSLEDPRKMSPAAFARHFGIPKDNADFDFLIVGRLSPGKMAITRSAPGVGGNVGGGMEVVVNPHSVVLDHFHMF